MAFDPLQQCIDLPLSTVLYPLGFPLVMESNSPAVIAAAKRVWREFPERFSEQPLRLRIIVSQEDTAEIPPPPVYRAQSHLFSIVAGRENYAVCDLLTGFGSAWLSPVVVSDPGYLRYYFLEAIVYCALTSLHLTSIHASCIAAGDSGVLLCGESGAGKSCLSYACCRAGLAFVSDDSSSLVRRDMDRMIVGKPAVIRFRETAAELFPELAQFVPKISANGKPTIEVCTEGLPGMRTSFQCRADFLVFLNRNGTASAVRTRPVSKVDARSRIERELPVLEPWSHDEQIASLDRLLEAECIELQYRDLSSGVAAIESLVTRGH
jgi:hypothetical protein